MPSVSAFSDENIKPLQNANASRCSTTTTSSTFSATNASSSPATPKSKKTTISLKRKRPPTIQIPSVLRQTQTDKITKSPEINKIPTHESIEYNEMGVAVFSKKGKKIVMEDAHKVVSALCGNPSKGFYGVYDGHGGKKAAEFVTEHLHQNIMEMLEKRGENSAKEEAVKAGFLKTDEEFLKQGLSSGTCCVTCLIEEKDMLVSNVGDCRAVLCKGGAAEVLTIDHRAEEEDERRRIEEMGGFVEFRRGAWRVHGILSVSRSIGDAHLKDWVVAEPHTRMLKLTPDMDFLVLASDGLWEKVGNQEAVDTAFRCLGPDKTELTNDPWKEDEYGCENTSPPSKSQRISRFTQQKLKTCSPLQEIKHHKKKQTPCRLTAACKELVNLAVARGSLDDITVMIIDLRHFQCKNLSHVQKKSILFNS